jgi:hypothetical protein
VLLPGRFDSTRNQLSTSSLTESKSARSGLPSGNAFAQNVRPPTGNILFLYLVIGPPQLAASHRGAGPKPPGGGMATKNLARW